MFRFTSKLVRASWSEPMTGGQFVSWLYQEINSGPNEADKLWEVKTDSGKAGLLIYDGYADKWGWILKGHLDQRKLSINEVKEAVRAVMGLMGASKTVQASELQDINLHGLTVQAIEAGKLEKELDKIKDPSLRGPFLEQWAALHLGNPLGKGSSRVVYSLDDEHVLKIALNMAGAAQNQVEHHLTQMAKDLPITDVKKAGNHFAYLVVERASEFVEAHFEKEYGMTFMKFAVTLCDRRSLPAVKVGKDPGTFSPQALELVQKLLKHNLSFGDILREEQWGDVGGESKMVDYGLTPGVWSEHYDYE